jgi:transcription initiation factor IIE alpha subunit
MKHPGAGLRVGGCVRRLAGLRFLWEEEMAVENKSLESKLAYLCVSCRRRVSWDPSTKLEQLCDRCWRLMAPEMVEESETLL